MPSLYVSRETPEQSGQRLLRVIGAAELTIFDGFYRFEQTPIASGLPMVGEETVALVRDDEVWSRLVRTEEADGENFFGLIRFHFPAGADNSGFVGWLSTRMKRTLGTGVFVICGQNDSRGGIFDYTGFPAALREAVLREVSVLQEAGRRLGGVP